ncbi:MAG TPA: hypothetical protein VJ717_03350 [Gemmatimonadaceae bacterium]|nr:hypothetical protein [Gemmatimonadaceae bacterium]
MRPPSFQPRSIILPLGLALLLSDPVGAQTQGDGFLFRTPVGSFAVRAGFSQANAGSDIFSFVTDELTLGRSDFAGLSYAADLAFTILPQLDLVFGGSYSGSSAESEFRHFVDNNDLPIEQTTSLARVPVTASAKLYLTSRGRSIGRYAWIPTKLAPFIGAGGGAMWYRFRQEGDFINMETTEVFPDKFESTGWTVTATGFGGLDVSLGPRFGFTGEGRYTWARAPMSEDFDGFERIDLSGYQASLGFYVRF